MSKQEQQTTKYLKFLNLTKANYKVFSVFFFISSFFWFLNALGKDYSIHVPVTLEYEINRDNQAIVGFHEHEVDMEIYGTGYSLLKYYLFESYFSTKVNVSELRKDSLATNEVVFIETFNALDKVYKGSFKIISVKPTVLTTTVSKIISKKVPVKTNVSLACLENYGIVSPYKIIPNSISIKGPQILLDTIQFVEVEDVELTDLDSDIDLSLEISPIEGVAMKRKSVSFSVKVQEYVRNEIEAPISFVNVSKRDMKKIENTSVVVLYKSLSQEPLQSISVIADFFNANQTEEYIPIKVNLPQGYELISVTPQNISYK